MLLVTVSDELCISDRIAISISNELNYDNSNNNNDHNTLPVISVAALS